MDSTIWFVLLGLTYHQVFQKTIKNPQESWTLTLEIHVNIPSEVLEINFFLTF